jgi:uncharacterized protein DUF4159
MPLAAASRRTIRLAAAFVLLSMVLASALFAQRGRAPGYGLPVATHDSFDGAFHFCRVAFRGIQGGDGGGWSTERNREPNHLIVQLTQPELFQCPFIMMFEVGNFYIDEVEAKNLRDYLLKGGFLWVDDFWGSYAWTLWESQIRKVFPSGTHPIRDLPLDHPLFHQVHSISKIPQIPSIDHWLSTGGGTSERFGDSAAPHVRAIVDERDRIMVLMTHNTDFGDAFEREGVNHQYFLTFSVDGYAFGINALVYSMTH